MSSDVRHLVDRGYPYPLVRLTGVLDGGTAPVVRSVLLDVLAEQPGAVIVDVGELSVTEPEAVDVLREVHRVTADWPAARLALCASHEAVVWKQTGWPIWQDSAKAVAELGPPDPQRLSVDLEPQVGAAREARQLTTEACGRWDRPELTAPACIVVTEMVNNVVAHARTPMVVLLAAHDAGLRVAVRDRSATVPTFSREPVPPTAHGGRGMMIIDSVTTRWGNLGLVDGKVVWAILEAEATPQQTPRHHHGADPGTRRPDDRTAAGSRRPEDGTAPETRRQQEAASSEARLQRNSAPDAWRQSGSTSSDGRRHHNPGHQDSSTSMADPAGG